MAINSYSTLQTAVANWLDRDDLSDRIPEFIDLNEALFNRTLRIRPMETIVTESMVGGTKSYDLPAGYVQMREIHLATSPVTALQYVSPEMLYRIWLAVRLVNLMRILLLETKSFLALLLIALMIM